MSVYFLKKLPTLGQVLLYVLSVIAVYLLFFANRYQLEEKQIPPPQAQALKQVAPQLFEHEYALHLTFLSATNKALAAYDADLEKKYSFSATQQARLVDSLVLQGTSGPWVVTDSLLRQCCDEGSKEDEKKRAFQQEALISYGGWLVGRSYESKEAFAADVQIVSKAISTYGIPSVVNIFPSWERNAVQAAWVRAAARGFWAEHRGLVSTCFFVLLGIACLLLFVPRYWLDGTPGIKHNGVYATTKSKRLWQRFSLGVTGVLLVSFYILLYFYSVWLTPWVMLLDPLSEALSGNQAGPFFLYGFLYTAVIILMGVRMFVKYRHSAYHKLRTTSLMIAQLAFAFLIPEFLVRMNKPYVDFKNIWPLDYDFFFDTEIDKLIQSGGLGIFMLGWGIALIIVAVPVFTYFYGKRWYCSWICGCGGLAETMGDPYRQHSNKSLRAWQIERYSIHFVLIFAVLMTAGVLYTYVRGEATFLGIIDSFHLRQTYGFYIGALFSGVVGTGFYPWMGSRVWCRFGCPLAAYLGLIQRFRSRFRITTNGGQCISCGNCSVYCEMGIDVRHYAQRGQDVVRSSCVGCGVCAAVCPRGVLKLENSTAPRNKIKLLGLQDSA